MVRVRNLTVKEFENRIQTNKVICLCAGNELRKLFESYPILVEKIIYVKDNFNYGKYITVNGYKIPVVSMYEKDVNLEDTMIIISSIKYAKDIILQLDEMQMYDGREVFIPYVLENDISHFNVNVEREQLIPKKIHYCWFGNSEMPKRFQKNIETWKRLCPEYEIIQWNESNYDITKCNYMKQAYELKKWGFVPDYARLDIINTYGGIYLDTDVELLKSLDNLLKYSLFCGFESLRFVAFGLGFGAMQGHVILQDMMKQYQEVDFIQSDGNLNLTPSPFYQTEVLKKYGLIQNGQCQEHKDYVVFSKEYFAPINAYGFGNVTDNTYSIHQYAATWFDEKQIADKQEIKDSVDFIMKRMKRDV